LRINPQGLVPVLEDEAATITQSLAILEYLEETRPTPALMPVSAVERAQVRALMSIIACDIHPLNNLRITTYLRDELAHTETEIERWIRHWISLGFEALERHAVRYGDGSFLHGDKLTLADVCLVPQMYNARRFGCDLAGFPRLVAIDAALAALPAVVAARPVEVG
jgi:maleylacetoacetate isomerase